jgi:hypothetical protein
MKLNIIAEFLLSIGSLIGLVVKADGLRDSDTVWPRRSSGFNVATYPFTALLPFYILELWSTLAISFLNFMVWIGIFIWRSEGDSE